MYSLRFLFSFLSFKSKLSPGWFRAEFDLVCAGFRVMVRQQHWHIPMQRTAVL